MSSSAAGYQQTHGATQDEEDFKGFIVFIIIIFIITIIIKGRPSDLNNETFKLIADFRTKRFEFEAALMAENRMEDNISRELSNLKRNQEAQTVSLNKARDDLQSFKYSKQCKLNDLDAVLMVTKAGLNILQCYQLKNRVMFLIKLQFF